MRRLILVLSFALFAGVLTACGGGGGSDSPAAAQPSDDTQSAPAGMRRATGTASKGPLQGAQVQLFEIDADGNKTTTQPVATGTTDIQGRFTLEPPVPATQAFLVETSGGEYVDESDPAASKRRIPLQAGEGLSALLPAGATTVAITPYSHALLARARIETFNGDFLAAFSRNRTLFQQTLGFDVANTIPQDPTQPNPSAPLAERQYALLLGGFANALNNAAVQFGLAIPSFELLQAMLVDLLDGRIDGRAGGGDPIMVALPGGPQPLPQDIDLNAEINRFRNNNAANYQNTAVSVDEGALSQGVIPSISVNDPVVTEGFVADVSPGQTPTGMAIRQNSGFNSNTLDRNDDGSTGVVPLGFTVDFFGLSFSSLFVNNNGNITFDSSLSTFTPFDLTTTDRQIIAPFFTDVDTRCNGDPVQYGPDTVDGHPAFGVNWINVDEFICVSATNLNSFQLVLISRSDIAPGAFDIEFNYDRIVWDHTNARAGFANGTIQPGTFFEIPGSGVNGAFLDSNTTTGLIHNTLGSSLSGRYVFQARDGDITSPVVARFLVMLDRPTSQAVMVNFQTQDGSAIAGSDYHASTGTLTIGPGQLLGSVNVMTVNDDISESQEFFSLTLSNSVNGTLADAIGVATILDDDNL